MLKNSMVILSIVLAVSLFGIFAQTNRDPGTNQTPAGASRNVATSVSSTNAPRIWVNVFFLNNRVITVEDLRIKAIAFLEKQGHKFDDSYACTVNVRLTDKSVGCYVHFVMRRDQPAYEVEFDKRGVAVKMRSNLSQLGEK